MNLTIYDIFSKLKQHLIYRAILIRFEYYIKNYKNDKNKINHDLIFLNR